MMGGVNNCTYTLMPPKKRKLVAGQQTLPFVVPSSSSSLLTSLPTSSLSVSTTTVDKGNTCEWIRFSQPKYLRDHPWICVRIDGVYCIYCTGHRKSVKSQSPVFVSKPFTGRKHDKLVRHETSKAHMQAADDFREAAVRKASHNTVVDVARQIPVVTEDGEAFKDILRLMHFLNKQEIAHTTNLSFHRELCIMVGNTTLPRLDKSKRTNYGSEQTMEELVRAIGVTLEEDILNEVCSSAYYGIIIDEATDIATTKQLGICVSYINSSGDVIVRNLKILEVVQGTADVLTDAIVSYLTHCSSAIGVDKACWWLN